MSTEENPAKEIKIHHDHIGLVAMTIGYNEMARMATSLGEKLYYRAMVEALSERMAANGQESPIRSEDGVLTFSLPGGTPHVQLYERDVELMRDYLADYDQQKK